jgi:dihydrofolate reductase
MIIYNLYKKSIMRYTIIVGYDFNNRAIGYDGRLYYSLKDDMAHFKEITNFTREPNRKNLVVMGRKTWDSLRKRPLPNRHNLVISSNYIDGVDTVNSITEAKTYIEDNTESLSINQVFIIGGATIYDQFLKANLVDEIIATEYIKLTDEVYPADTFFPTSYLKGFNKAVSIYLGSDSKFTANVVRYVRK